MPRDLDRSDRTPKSGTEQGSVHTLARCPLSEEVCLQDEPTHFCLIAPDQDAPGRRQGGEQNNERYRANPLRWRGLCRHVVPQPPPQGPQSERLSDSNAGCGEPCPPKLVRHRRRARTVQSPRSRTPPVGLARPSPSGFRARRVGRRRVLALSPARLLRVWQRGRLQTGGSTPLGAPVYDPRSAGRQVPRRPRRPRRRG